MRKSYCGSLTVWLVLASLALGQGRPGGPATWEPRASGSKEAEPGVVTPTALPANGQEMPTPHYIVYGPLGQVVLPGAKKSPARQRSARPLPPAVNQSPQVGRPAPAHPSLSGIVQTQSQQMGDGSHGAGTNLWPISDKKTIVDDTVVEQNQPTDPLISEGATEGTLVGNAWDPPRQERRPPVGPRGYLFFGRAEFLYWFVRDQPYRDLLQYGAGPGAITVPSEAIHFDSLERQGTRLSFGLWLDAEQTMAWEVGGFILGSHDTFTRVGSTGTPPLFINYYEVALGGPRSIDLTPPGVPAVVDFRTVSRLWGAETNFRRELYRPTGPVIFGHLDALAGFRFAQLEDKLHMNVVNVFPTTTIGTSDRFDSLNSFYGFQLGLDGEVECYNFYGNLWGKLGIGANQQDVHIRGDGFRTPGGVFTPHPVGVFALASNIGDYYPSEFALLPEVGVNAGYKLTEFLRLSVGYSMLWLTNTLRAADQMSSVLNLTYNSLRGPGLLPPNTGAAGPFFQPHSSLYWAHGVNIGLECRY